MEGKINMKKFNGLSITVLLIFLFLVNHVVNADTGYLKVDPDDPKWFRYDNEEPFFMCGPGDPEGFLYRGELKDDGTRDGDQMKLIRKLVGTGANCIYLMAVRSHGGDGGETENPFVDHDPKNEINQKVLDQWETWFKEMDRNGIVIYFFIYDDSAVIWNRKGQPNQDNIHPKEKEFIQTLVNRFEHHRNLVWCIAEEYSEGLTKEHVRKMAALIRETDDHNHPIAVHQHTGVSFDFADDPVIDQFAIQLGVAGGTAPSVDALHKQVVQAWKNVKGRYSLNMSELGGHYEAGKRDVVRQRNWASAMAGAYVMVIEMDIDTTPVEVLNDCGRLVGFFTTVNLKDMAPHDEWAGEGADYVFAAKGKRYIVYGANTDDSIRIKSIPAGKYDLRWYDTVSGKWSDKDNVALDSGAHTFQKPGQFGNEVALYITRR